MTVNCLLLIAYLEKTERYVTDFFYSFYIIYYSLPIQSQTRIMRNMHTWMRVQDCQTLFLNLSYQRLAVFLLCTAIHQPEQYIPRSEFLLAPVLRLFFFF